MGMSNKKNMSRVFLSHSSKDKPLARAIAEDLRRVGFSVWLDEWEILIGESISQKIQEGLQNTDFVAVLLTQNSVDSGWVEKEWQSKIGDEARTKKVIILPLKGNNCRIPLLLKDKKYADFTQDYASAIKGVINSIKIYIQKKGMDSKNLTDIDIKDLILEKVFGQPEAVEVCANELNKIKFGMKDSQKPTSVLFFMGALGVGKTELAKIIASIYSPTKQLVVLSMSNFSTDHSVHMLLGSPPGYIGAEEGGILTNEINKNPHCVMLLDEIEKAHPEVLIPFLTLFEQGWIYDKRNVKADARNCIFIMNTLIGATEAYKMFEDGAPYEKVKKAVVNKLQTFKKRGSEEPLFSPEFLYSIKDFIIFRPLNKEAIPDILKFELTKRAKEWLEIRNKIVIFNQNVVDLLIHECHRRCKESGEYAGARVVHKFVQDYIDTLIVKLIVKLPTEEFNSADTLIFEGDNLNNLRVILTKR